MTPPDEQALRADLDKAVFRLGEAEKRWDLCGITWPYVFMSIKAKDGCLYVLRFDCMNYPQTPPTATLWDSEQDRKLSFDRWPQSKSGCQEGQVGAVFRNWNNGESLYLPCDRMAIPGHTGWETTMRTWQWQPDEGIVKYLRIVHGLLHCRDYASPTSVEA